MAITVAAALSMSAQEPDLAAIAQMRKVKADSLGLMLGKVYGTQAAMNHTTADARALLLKSFDETLNLDKQDEQYREGNSMANEFFKVAGDMKKRSNIDLNRTVFAQSLLTRLADTTAVANMNTEVAKINEEAKHLISEITALNKDSLARIEKASLIALKSDSLSMNMARFYGLHMRNMIKQKKLTPEQVARFVEGFNSGINIDENNKPLVDGKMLGNDFANIAQGIKRQLKLELNKESFINSLKTVLNDPKVPTDEEFKALDNQARAYVAEVTTFAQENSAEALTQRTMGKLYIDNLMEKDPGYVQAPSGLVYKIINPGKGNKFTANDKIKVMYKGTHVDGKTFDESKDPVTFAPSQVVPGFREALLMMRPGAKMIAVLPHNIAYGARGAGQAIKPFETLIFEIETLGLEEESKSQVDATKIGKAAVEPQPAGKTVEPKASTGKASKTKKSSGKKKTSKRKK